MNHAVSSQALHNSAYQVLNAPAEAYLVHALGALPGQVRKGGPMEYSSVYGSEAIILATDEYQSAGLDDQQKALGLHLLARAAVMQGYGKEAVQIAGASDCLDTEHRLQAANLGLKAYAMGMIDGQFNMANEFYKSAEHLLRGADKWDDIAFVESRLNRGHIYHRVGLSNPVYMHNAVEMFEQGLARVNDADAVFTEDSRLEYKTQLTAAFAKTLTHIARRNPKMVDATPCIRLATSLIEHAIVMAGRIPGYAFERAAMQATRGDILAAVGRRDEAVAALQGALREQKAAGSLVPRLVATEAKLRLAEGETDMRGAMGDAVARLTAFHGTEKHPSIIRYRQRLRANENPQAIFLPPQVV